MKTITPAQAKELNQNFVKTRSKAIDTAIGKKDALSSWFSLDDLKAYISKVEKEGKDRGIDVNGLRVYFGAYSETLDNPEKKGYATVFFVPTQPKINVEAEKNLMDEDESSDIEGMDPLNEGTVGYPPSAVYPQ